MVFDSINVIIIAATKTIRIFLSVQFAFETPITSSAIIWL